MVKVLKTSQGKVLTLNGDVLTTNAIVPTGTLNITENDTYDVTNYASAVVNVSGGGGDIIEAINNTGAAISADDKVFIAPLTTPQSGADYEIVAVKTTDTPSFGFWAKGDVVIDLTNKEASSFSQNKYLEVPMVFDYTQPWEFNICLQTGNSVSGQQWIYFGSTTSYGEGGIQIDLLDSKFRIYISVGTTTSLVNINNYSVAANTTYYVRIGWTGTEYYIRYSVNGTDWTSETPVTSSVQAAQRTPAMRIGSRLNNSSYFTGKIFLDKTYFISNGNFVWQALYDGTWSNIGKDVVTGIANESIASGSVGEVTTLLGE